jgi:transposase
MQPRCNRHLRPLLVEASWMAIRRSPALFAYYSKHAVRNPKRAIIKVARRLAMIAKGVATTQQLYQPEYLQTMRQKQQDEKKGRFSSGITNQHKDKKPDNNIPISLPG